MSIVMTIIIFNLCGYDKNYYIPKRLYNNEHTNDKL